MARNRNIIAHASAAETTSGQTGDYVNRAAKGCVVTVNITAITGTSPTAVFTLEGKSANGEYVAILASASLTATGVTQLKIYPALTAAANTVANDVLPSAYRLRWTIGGTTPSVTFAASIAEIQ